MKLKISTEVILVSIMVVGAVVFVVLL